MDDEPQATVEVVGVDVRPLRLPPTWPDRRHGVPYRTRWGRVPLIASHG
jgi:hypothetical protein